ncbi:MAG: hypothetical protein CEE38_08465 [Planctomycetes bacterium B3_Pla]|nr:MAG: hypothetical protein CEE38_08465 [Planctomycetes bacterium B3_Pla]
MSTNYVHHIYYDPEQAEIQRALDATEDKNKPLVGGSKNEAMEKAAEEYAAQEIATTEEESARVELLERDEADAAEEDTTAIETAYEGGELQVKQLRRKLESRPPETDAQSNDAFMAGLSAAGGDVDVSEFSNPEMGAFLSD